MIKHISPCILCVALVVCLCTPFTAEAAYTMGEKAADFTVTLSDGSAVTLYGLLEEYDAVLLNFFFIDCYWCNLEFPYLEKAYETYSDKVAVLAVAPYDEVEDIAAFKEENGYTFLLGAVEYGTVEEDFGVTGYPTSFLIDREGAVCLEESTTPSAYVFKCLFEAVTDENYVSPELHVVFPPVYAADAGCPAALSGDEVEVTFTFDGKKDISCRKIVFEGLPPELEKYYTDRYYILPDCSGEMHVRLGPELDLTAVSVGYCLLIDLEQDETGFVCPFRLDAADPVFNASVEKEGGPVICDRTLIHESYDYAPELKSYGFEFHEEDAQW